jgi:2-polyprenyl-3-methyl-5-hydroxy-6-metoxy-1,4-benzoquinol methylase
MTEAVAFDKYDIHGAYHWAECDRRYGNWKHYNPALDARYEITIHAILNLRLRGDFLDVGCGDGLLMARLAPIMHRVVGIDSEGAAIRWAKEQLREFANCELLHTASSDLPFAENVFEVVASADVIEHLKDPAHHLREISRMLRPEGALVLTTPKWRPDRKWDVRHEKEYRPEELRALLERHFGKVELLFFWPMKWSRFYATKLGWRLLKLVAIQFHNPFLRTGTEPEKFGQILAVCREPRDDAQ